VEIEQLELDLWQSLETAIKFPQTAEFHNLCTALEFEIAEQRVSEQLRIASDVIVQLSEIYAARSEILLSEWERRYNPTEPVVDIDGCVELFVQSLNLDVAELFEPLEPVHYPEHRRSPTISIQNNSLVGEVDRAVLLEVLEPELDDETALAEALDVAHDEDVSAWVRAISLCFDGTQAVSLSLVELVQKVKYPIVKGEKKSTLVKTWLALLLGGFKLEQSTEDFYCLEGILVHTLD